MKLKPIFLLALALVLGGTACSSGAESANKGNTYRMEKGGMSSMSHEMPASPQSDDEDAKKKEGYRMEKGAMGNVGHDMK